MTEPIQAGLLAFLLALAATPLVRLGALRAGFVARPRADRWHRREVALLGGAAIFAATTIAAPVFTDLTPATTITLALAALTFLVGLVDDVRPMRPATKLVLQMAVALALAFARPDLGLTGVAGLDVLVTAFWLVAIMNAINLLDNMDGLAAGVALVAVVFAVALGWRTESADLLCLQAALGGALAGFLVYNFNPASIFMGDGGSLFIGFLLAAAAIPGGGEGRSSLVAAVSVPAVLLAIPILDTALVSVMRVLSRRRISDGGRDHTSHRLVAVGLTERAAVLVLYALAGAAGLVALLVRQSAPVIGVAALLAFGVALALFAIYVAQVRVYEEGHLSALEEHPITPLLMTLTFKRRLFEVTLDLVLVWVAYTVAFWLRFEGEPPPGFESAFLQSMPLVLVAKMLGLWIAGVYGGVWRFLSIPDLLTYVKGAAYGSALSVLAIAGFFRFQYFSRGVFVVDALLMFLLIVGARLSFRLLAESIGRRRTSGAPVLVYGAGKGGATLLREVASNADLDLRAVGLMDDDPHKHGQRVLGVPVLGGLEHLEALIDRTGAQQVIVSTSTIPPSRLHDLEARCAAREVRVRRMSFVIE